MNSQVPTLHLRYFTPFGLWIAQFRLALWTMRYFSRFIVYEESQAFKFLPWIPLRRTVLYIESEDGLIVFWRDPQLPAERVDLARNYIRKVYWSSK